MTNDELEIIKLTGKDNRVDIFKKVVIEGHEYIINTDNWKMMIHNENCPCKRHKNAYSNNS